MRRAIISFPYSISATPSFVIVFLPSLNLSSHLPQRDVTEEEEEEEEVEERGWEEKEGGV